MASAARAALLLLLLLETRTASAVSTLPTTNPYRVLGVSRMATADEVRTAFRRAAKRIHPDVSAAPDAELQFQRLAEAHEILSNPSARASWERSSRATASSTTRSPWQPRHHHQPSSSSKNRAGSLLLTLSFVGGQWLSWWLFLESMAGSHR